MNTWKWTKANGAKSFFNISRWLHVYISTALFSLLVFFSFTGITLNHTEWLGSDSQTHVENITLPDHIGVVLDNQSYGKELEAFITSITRLEHPRSVEIDNELGEILLDYPLPAGFAFVTVSLSERTIEVEYQRANVWVLMNDLHKGRHSGKVWSWLIDLSATLMIVFAVTGLILILPQKRRRISSLVLVGLGSITPLILYWAWVPKA